MCQAAVVRVTALGFGLSLTEELRAYPGARAVGLRLSAATWRLADWTDLRHGVRRVCVCVRCRCLCLVRVGLF